MLVSDAVVGEVGPGLCVFVGVGREDTGTDAETLARKVVGLRIFEDEAGKMNRDLLESGGAILAVSQFTLYGDTRRGKRPSFSEAKAPEEAEPLFDAFCAECRSLGVQVETGRFRAHMVVALENAGPVTLLIDTAKVF